MKRKIFSVLLALVLVLSFGLVTAVPVAAQGMPDAMVFPFELGGKTTEIDDYVAEWSTAQVHGGSSSVHLQTTGTVGNGDEARILIDLSGFPEGEMPTLGDLTSISWYEYLVAGYPPHIDIYLDINGDGTADDALVIEYAYNSMDHVTAGWPTYGAVTGDWFQTFSDDGDGPAVIDDDAYAWLTSREAGPVGGEFGDDDHWGTTLGDWKAGKTTPAGDISADTVVIALEIEVDNWIVQSEAYVDDIAVNGTLVAGQIQDAVDTVPSDAFVYVLPGIYTENVNVNKSLALYGADKEATIIDGGGSGIVVTIPVDNVTVSGFTITGSGATLLVDGGIGLLTVTGCTIKDNIVSNNAGIGIGLMSGSGNTIKNNTLDKNHLAGIGLQGSSNNVIESNLSTGTFKVEIPLVPLEYKGYGIVLDYGSSGNTINGNAFSDNEVDGVYFGEGSGGNKLTNNIITDNGKTGGVDSHGVYLWKSSTNTITGNTITGNLASGIQLYQSTDNHINFNDISNNTNYGINTDTAVDAGMNWWGNISGPTFAGSGQYYSGAGDKVSGNVRFEPWLTRDFQTVFDDNIQYFGFPMVQLNTGWNTLSTPVALDPGCDTWGEYVALGDGLNIHSTSPAYAFNGAIKDWVPLTATYKLKPCDAIYVRMAEPDVGAILYSPEPSAPTKDVYQGWNLVSLASLDPMLTNNALTSLYMATSDRTGYSVVISPPLSQSKWTFVRGGSPQIMQPTRGYWVFMENGPDTLAGFTFTPFSLEGPPVGGGGGLWEVPFQWYSMTTSSADDWDLGDDGSFTYWLPWSFPFAGKEIVEIAVSSNGFIELLESGESCDTTACEDYDYMSDFKIDYPGSDFIFAWEDDLSSSYYGFYGVKYNGDVVVVHWTTETWEDGDDELLNYFQLWLFPDGSIQWNFKEFNYDSYGYGLESGIYESDSGTILSIDWEEGKSYKYFGQYWP